MYTNEKQRYGSGCVYCKTGHRMVADPGPLGQPVPIASLITQAGNSIDNLHEAAEQLVKGLRNTRRGLDLKCSPRLVIEPSQIS
ncbi:MAG: hypothetical protein ABSA77_04920 [Thermoguttaceae bacterium]